MRMRGVLRSGAAFLRATAATETRAGLYGTTFGTLAIIAVYAALHDQYLVRICPEHFTLYHANPFGIEPAWKLALAWAMAASLSPGAALGTANFFIGRAGGLPQVPVRFILKGVLTVVLATEALALLAGAWVWRGGAPPYPWDWYPESTGPIVITQTIQVSTYAAGFLFSGVWLLVLARCRRRLRRSAG